MAKLYFFKLVFATILVQVVAAQEFYSIELDGKFKQSNGPYITDILTTGRFTVTDQTRLKRDAPLAPPLTFEGTVTFRSQRSVSVHGVNSSVQLSYIQTDVEDDVDSNRVKRDESENRKIRNRIGFYGQFGLGHPFRNPEVLGINLSLELGEITREYLPATSDVVMNNIQPKVEFGFKGKIINMERGSSALFDLSVGFQDAKTLDPESDDDTNPDTNRIKRDSGPSKKPILKIDGQFVIDELRRDGATKKFLQNITGEVTFENMPRSDPSPKDLFYADSSNRDQTYFETAGNVTGKINNQPFFIEPFSSGIRTTVLDSRKKRNAAKTEILELDYDGTFSLTHRASAGVRPFGVSAKFEFWRISEVRFPKPKE